MLKKLLPLLAGLTLIWPLSAHPHVWIDSGLELVVEGNMVKGFWAEWAFDEMMSAMILADAPVGANGRFSPANTARIRDGYFRNLSNFGYFSYAWQDRRPIPLHTVTGFEVSVSGGRLNYRFFFPLNRTIPPAGTEITISMYDETYFTDMGFRQGQPVRVSGIAPERVSFRLTKNPARAYWGGQIHPEEAVITIRPSR